MNYLKLSSYEGQNLSTVQHLTEHDQFLIFKGAFLWLSPLTIPLCLVVMLQNVVIFINYYKDRAKLVAGLFMGIAVADMLKAQGELVLSVVSILVYSGTVEVTVLYSSLFYYMVTALPGINWSKVFNLAMSITLTARVVDPFRSINVTRVKKVIAAVCAFIMFLHVSDFIVVYFVFDKSPYTNKRQLHRFYLYLMMGFSVPGSGIIVSLICKPDKTGDSTCHATWQFAVFGFMAFIYYVAIPLTVLICMLIQIKYLRKSFKDPDTSSQAPNDTVRHITITVLWVSVLFFICNATYFFLMLTWGILNDVYHYDTVQHQNQVYVNLGILVGFTEFTLSLIYAVVYPVILICRKEDLRRRYRGYWRQLFSWCRTVPDTDL